MSIDWAQAGNVISSGVVIVFAILAILIGAVVLMGKIMGSKPEKAIPAPAPVSVPKQAPVSAPTKSAATGIPEETIAAISAAVGAYMEEAAPGVPYAVTGIAPTGSHRGNRPGWGFAGMRQNTEPF